jgi:hypothetical protein
VVKRILAHLGLVMEAFTAPEDPVWLPRKSALLGPPDELFPPVLDDTGLPAEPNAVDEGLSEPPFDEPPAQDWERLPSGVAGGPRVC